MGVLEAVDGSRHVLLATVRVGRASGSELQLRGPDVSALHAWLRWTGEHWEIEDRGSKNGTMVDGRVLREGQRAPLGEGSTLVFAADQVWILRDARAPEYPMAVPLAGGSPIAAEHGQLALPDGVTVTRAGGRTRLGDTELEHEEVVVAGGRSFRILTTA